MRLRRLSPACAILLLSSTIFLFSVHLLLAQSTTTVNAQATSTATSTESPTISQISQDIEERAIDIEMAVTRITEQANLADPILSDRTLTRFRNLAANTSNRLDAAVLRLERITERTNQRITISAEAGHRTDQAKRAKTVAERSLLQATESLRTIDKNVERFLTSSNPGRTFPILRTIYEMIHQDIRDAQSAIRIALNELEQAASFELLRE